MSAVVLALVTRQFSNWAMPLYAMAILYAIGGLCWLVIDASTPGYRLDKLIISRGGGNPVDQSKYFCGWPAYKG